MARRGTAVEALRRGRVARSLPSLGLDAALITDPADVRYLSGFTGEDSYLLMGGDWAVLLTDGRFTTQAERDCPAIEHHIRTGAMSVAVAEVLRGRSVRRLGLQAEHATLALLEALGKTVGEGKLYSAEGLVSPFRESKDDHEIAAIGKAVRVAERAFRGLIASGAKGFVGRREVELAAELEYRMRQEGAEGASFPTIVAAGSHGALPHYRPAGARIREGQAVLIDWGAVVDGYCSDLTRVVFTARIPPQLGEVYEVVLRAQCAGIAAVRAGRSASAVDAAARSVIEQAGYGPQFGHGLGHGVGLVVHEAPRVSARCDERLRKHAVVTIEPGVYLPGVGGVRIEDDVLVESDRGRVLSRLPRQLQAMVLT